MSESQPTGLPHWHCTNCHHEWDGRSDACDWCGAMGSVIGQYSWAADMMEVVRAMAERMNAK